MVDVTNLVKLYFDAIPAFSIVFSRKVRTFCTLPYPDHPKGCPNYDKSPSCPPKSRFRNDILKKYNHFALVRVVFDIKAYATVMKTKHSSWTEKQCRNLLYWQPALRKIMRREITKYNHEKCFGSGNDKQVDSQSMESAGIHVFPTLRRNKIKFDIKALKYVTLVSLLCSSIPIMKKKTRSIRKLS